MHTLLLVGYKAPLQQHDCYGTIITCCYYYYYHLVIIMIQSHISIHSLKLSFPYNHVSIRLLLLDNKMISNVFPISYLEPCLLLSRKVVYLPSTSRCSSSLHIHSTMQSVTLSSFSTPGSRQLMLIVSYIVYLVLSFLLLYSSSGFFTDVFSY